MTLRAAVGFSSAVSERQAGQEAAQQALQQVERGEALAAFVICPARREISATLAGIVETLGDAPLLGLSSPAVLTCQGLQRQSVAVGVLTGEGFYAQTSWRADYAQDGRTSALMLLQALRPEAKAGDMLLAIADGLADQAQAVGSVLRESGCRFAGALAAGEVLQGQNFQIGGRQAGSGGLALGVFGGPQLVLGLGVAHGWQAVGALARLNRAQHVWLQEMNQQTAAQTFAHWFGNQSQDWLRPPLSQMIRLYPLAFEEDGLEVLRLGLGFEADGSLRFNLPVPQSQSVALMVGTPDSALAAVKQAAQQALENLGEARPVLALLFLDQAYQNLWEIQPGAEIRFLRQVIGPDVPVLGAYTLGQLNGPSALNKADVLNGQVEVILFGERKT